jgi:membrane-bound lytic murein transglycosylase B
VSRARVVGSVLVPAVLVLGAGAVVVPQALAAHRASVEEAATLDAAGPAGVLAVLDGARPEAQAPKTRVVPVPAAVTVTVDALPPAGAAAVDGTAVSAVVDDAAAQAEAAAALTSHGVVVTDGSTGIPVTVLAAYRKAEANLAAAKPSCHLPWWVLAGIGRIESGHASGGRVDGNGTTRGRILGIALDGSVPGTAVVLDSDGGRWDGDATYDRAVGPMQFLPSSWRVWGKDGNGDGVADPNNVFDAATGAGYLLCSAGDLADPATLSRAVLMYNHSAAYVASVLRWGAAYRDGVTPSPDSAGVVPAGPVQQPASTPSVASSTAAPPASAAGPAPTAATSSTTSRAPTSPSSSSTTPPATGSSSATSTTSPTSATTSTTSSTTTSPTSTTTTRSATSSPTTTSPTTTTPTTTTPTTTTPTTTSSARSSSSTSAPVPSSTTTQPAPTASTTGG